jgi:4a-hydroxytetrahydrobiopterin dehydratase
LDSPARLAGGGTTARLSDQEVEKRLRELKGWRRAGNAIEKEFKFKAYMDAIDFINRIARVAEEEEHHPDIHNTYTTVKLSITTHDEGGLTPYDFDLAKRIDKVG